MSIQLSRRNFTNQTFKGKKQGPVQRPRSVDSKMTGLTLDFMTL